MITAQELLDAISNHGSITFAAWIAKTKATNLANLLKFALPETISRQDHQITIRCAKPNGHAPTWKVNDNVSIVTDQTIKFQINTASNKTSLTNIFGLNAQAGPISVRVMNLNISVISDDRFRISGTASLGIKFNVVVDANGNVVHSRFSQE